MMKKLTLILALVMMVAFCCGSTSAMALENSYSDVLSDLKTDVLFTADKYPEDTSSTKLEVITLAESVNNELFVYVYSPGKKEATSINIAIDSRNPYFRNYELELLNQNGVFYKYKVVGLQVATVTDRYYEVASIFRNFIDGVDETPAGGNTVSEVSFAVGIAWSISGAGDNVTIKSSTVEVITVTDKHVGFIRYPNGGIFGSFDHCDVHYVAFSTDKRIDELLQVDVTYRHQTYRYEDYAIGVEKKNFSDVTSNNVTVDASVAMTHNGSGWFSNDYKWQSIETSTDFLKGISGQTVYKAGMENSVAITELNDKSLISSKDWVFRFAITEYDETWLPDPSDPLKEYSIYEASIISDVTILRLKFKTDEQTFNLGVVDNKQTGAVDPDTGLPVPDNPNGVDIVPKPGGLGDGDINWLVVAIAAVVVFVVGKVIVNAFR